MRIKKNFFFYFQSVRTAYQSLHGIDILNGLLTGLAKHHPKILLDEATNSASAAFARMLLIYANFILGASIVQRPRLYETAYRKFKELLRSSSRLIADMDKQMVQVLIRTACSEKDNALNRLTLCGFLWRHFSESDSASDQVDFEQLRTYTMEAYLNGVVGSRVRTKEWLVKSRSYWLRFCSRDDFSSKLLPEIKRSLLRNPEIVLESNKKNLR